jgi:hypothetical protein
MEFQNQPANNFMTTLSINYKRAYCKKEDKITITFRRLDVEKTNSKA